MKVLVSGADGFIGGALKARLVLSGYQVEEISYDAFPNLKGYLLALRSMEVDAVFHVGADSNTQEVDISRVMERNVLATHEIAQYCASRQIPLIYSSSASVYGDGSGVPQNLYAWSKLLGESYVRLVGGVSLRYFNVYGPGENHKRNMASFAFQAMKLQKQGSSVTLFPGTPRRDFIHVDDVVAANLYALDRYPTLGGGIFDVGTGEDRSFEDMLQILGIDWEYAQESAVPDGYQFFTRASSDLFLPGWKPLLRLEEGLIRYKELLEKSNGYSWDSRDEFAMSPEIGSATVNHAEVIVVGDLMIDNYVFGEVKRLSPEAPVPVFRELSTQRMLGGASNLASAISRLGTNCCIKGWWGDDTEGRLLEELLSEEGIIFERLGIIPKTTTKTRIIAGGQNVLRIDSESVRPPEKALTNFSWLDRLPPETIVALSDYGKAVSGHVETIISECRDRGLKIFVDPKGANLSIYRGAYLLKPNLEEFELLFGLPIEAEAEIFSSLVKNEISNLLVTMGPLGMKLFETDSREVTLLESSSIASVYDVTGAGDMVLAGLVVAFRSGSSLRSALGPARALAESNLKGLGSSMTAEAAISYFTASDGPTLSTGQATTVCDLLRSEGKKIVFTNGCFDLLHPGHVSLIEAARSRGDFLIVGLNSDDSVRKLKGSERPVYGLDARASILTQLRGVGCVVSFSESDPLELIGNLRPDVLVKGADYRAENVVGASLLASWGGEVHIVDLLEGNSTSSTIARLKGAAT